MKKDDYGSDVFRSLAMISQFGIYMIVPILLCGGLGLFLDRRFSTNWICIAGFFLGALAGFRNIFLFARKIYSDESLTRRQKDRIRRRAGGEGKEESRRLTGKMPEADKDSGSH